LDEAVQSKTPSDTAAKAQRAAAAKAQSNTAAKAQRADAADQPPSELLSQLRVRQEQLKALLDERLDQHGDLEQLLGVDPTNRLAAALQLRQWRAVLGSALEVKGDAGVATERPEISADDPTGQVWEAQLELTRLRSRFFELPASEQVRLLERYQAR